MISGHARAIVVPWCEMDRWVVPSGAILSRQLPAGWTRPRVGELVQRVSNLVKVEPNHEYKTAGVKWYGGGVFYRETVRGNEQSAKWLTPLVPGALIYNRLFAWKASFAVVPSDLAECYVSNEFPQFVPDTSRVLPEYLYLWCVSDQTIKAVNAASTGSAAVSRNRFREEFFVDFKIPLPPLPVQRKIVVAHESARDCAAQAAAEVERLERDIEAHFLADLGLSAPKKAALPKVAAVRWSDFLRWSVSYNMLSQWKMDITRSRYPLADVGSLAELIQYGTSEKANTAGDGTPVIRMNNLVDGLLDMRKIKHIRLPETEARNLKLEEGDILFNRTNSKELVGKCAVFHEHGEYVFASYLIRVRVDSKLADADFVAFALNSPIGRQQIDALSRPIIGQANVNSEELRSLEIPFPPLPAQQAMMKRVESGRAEIARLKREALARTELAKADVEAMILGTKPI